VLGGRSARIGFLGEETGLYPFLTAPEISRLVGELFRLPGIPIRRARSACSPWVVPESKARAGSRRTQRMRQRLGSLWP